MQRQGWTTVNKNPKITPNTQPSYQNNQKQKAFLDQSPTHFQDQKENKENSMQDQKQKVYNYDDLQDLCSQRDILRFLGYYDKEEQNYSNRNRCDERNYQGTANINQIKNVDNNSTKMMDESSENQSNMKQQQSTVQLKIPYNHDFVIFTVNCPKLGISKQDLLKKKESLQSRKLNSWVPQKIKFNQWIFHPSMAPQVTKIDKQVLWKNCKIPNELKSLDMANIIQTNQQSTRMSTRRDHNQKL